MTVVVKFTIGAFIPYIGRAKKICWTRVASSDQLNRHLHTTMSGPTDFAIAVPSEDPQKKKKEEKDGEKDKQEGSSKLKKDGKDEKEEEGEELVRFYFLYLYRS